MGGSIILLLGGARSGKSRAAERIATAQPGPLTVIATAEAGDAEMATRIARHRADRSATERPWSTVEVPLNLREAIEAADQPGARIVIDCLTLWISNLFGAQRDPAKASADLAAWRPKHAACVIFVSNEVGLGLVPESALGRTYRDALGRLHQDLAAVATSVVLMVAGLPLALKGPLPPPLLSGRVS